MRQVSHGRGDNIRGSWAETRTKREALFKRDLGGTIAEGVLRVYRNYREFAVMRKKRLNCREVIEPRHEVDGAPFEGAGKVLDRSARSAPAIAENLPGLARH
jgi:hypothetical protein